MRADEFCFSITDGTHDSPKPQPTGKKLITSKHLKGTYIDFDSANCITEQDYQKIISRSRVDQWDILYSMIGTIGNVYIEKAPNIEYGCKNVAIFKFDGDSDKAYWLYYYLQSPKAKEYIHAQLRGSTQSYVPLGALRGMPVTVPSKVVEKEIIEILKALDGKIELNNKIKANLQQQAQAIFKSWFVDFEPFQDGEFVESELGPIPKGWSVGRLADICTYGKDKITVSELTPENYFSTENMLANKGGYTSAASLPNVLQTTRCIPGDTLVSNIRPYFKKIVYCTMKAGCSTDVLCLRPKHPQYSTYLYNLAYSDTFFDYMVAGSKGTKMPRGDKQQIMSYPVPLPTGTELGRFNSMVVPILALIQNNCNENKRLSILRDTLLPKLMNGEICIL